MTRKMDVDWSDWSGKVEQKSHQLSKPVPTSTKGADVVSGFSELVKSIISDAQKTQPTKEQFEAAVAARMPSEKEVKEAEYRWENRFNIHLNGLNKPIDHLNKNAKVNKKWEYGKSFNSLLEEEELIKRNTYIKE